MQRLQAVQLLRRKLFSTLHPIFCSLAPTGYTAPVAYKQYRLLQGRTAGILLTLSKKYHTTKCKRQKRRAYYKYGSGAQPVSRMQRMKTSLRRAIRKVRVP